jgi:Fe-S cluster assembly ATPase SufC
MIRGEAALVHHLLQVAIRELVSAIPAGAQKDDCGLEVAPLERGLVLLDEYDSGSMMTWLESGL